MEAIATFSSVGIEEILLKIGEKEIKLTLQEAINLQGFLNRTFRTLGYVPAYPYYPITIYPVFNPWPQYGPYTSCWNSSANSSGELKNMVGL